MSAAAVSTELAPFRERAEAVLSRTYLGLHHIPYLDKARWTDRHVRVTLHDGLSTFDNDALTRLVVAAHDHCVRAEIIPLGRYLGLFLHDRKRDGEVWERHPSIEEHVAWVRYFRAHWRPERGGRVKPPTMTQAECGRAIADAVGLRREFDAGRLPSLEGTVAIAFSELDTLRAALRDECRHADELVRELSDMWSAACRSLDPDESAALTADALVDRCVSARKRLENHIARRGLEAQP